MHLLRTTPIPSSNAPIGSNVYRVEQVNLKNKNSSKPYAILSHRWEDEEVSLQDLAHNVELLSSQKPSSYQKLQESCRVARENGFEYIWNDTCCINKENSAEVSEELNSMFSYYADSAVCYVYLNDVSVDQDLSGDGAGSFRKSQWFLRGWTLQELLAPSSIFFFDKDWKQIGTKSSLSDILSEITGVSKAVLSGERDISDVCIAQRMSWAARRSTTRPEDVAYCLMGMFSVNMPVLYGEGETRAFLRLQEEIIKYNGDPTIFVWKSADAEDGPGEEQATAERYERGLLAWSPSEFIESSDVQLLPGELSTHHTLTNRGVSITCETSWLSMLVPSSCLLDAFIFTGLLVTFLIFWVKRIKTQQISPLVTIIILSIPIQVIVIIAIIRTRHIIRIFRIINIFRTSPSSEGILLNYYILIFAFLLILAPDDMLGTVSGVSVFALASYSLFMRIDAWTEFSAIRVRLPCYNGKKKVVEIVLHRSPYSEQWFRMNPRELRYYDLPHPFNFSRRHFIWYTRRTIYVKEDFLVGRRLGNRNRMGEDSQIELVERARGDDIV